MAIINFGGKKLHLSKKHVFSLFVSTLTNINHIVASIYGSET